MMKKTLILSLICLIAASSAIAQESDWEGRLRIGGIVKDEKGDRAAMQETYNIYDGFNIPSIYLNGRFNSRNYLKFDLTDFAMDNRRGYLDYRMTGLLKVRSRYTQSAQVFDPTRATESQRKNFFATASVTPGTYTEITGDYRLIKRTGDRIGWPGGVESNLGDSYDYNHHFGRLAVEVRTDRVGGTVALDATSLKDKVNELNDRDGQVLSANVFLPGIWIDRLTHVARGAIGESKLPTAGTNFKMYVGQYTGLLALYQGLQFKYRLYGSRVDDSSTGMFTDNFSHDFDLIYRDRWGSVAGGYGWEALDDDRSVTTYNNWRASVYLRTSDNKVSGNVTYASRDKEDMEKQTLLMDTETTRLKGKIDYRATKDLTIGGYFASRNRDLPDIGSKIEGQVGNAYARYSSNQGDVTGSVMVNYQFGDDDYQNIDSKFTTRSNFITGTLDFDWRDLNAGTAMTYMRIKEDLDIEKSVLSFWAGYTFLENWEARAKYNVYNYDDYLIITASNTNRFYTANIVWFDIGYHFGGK